MKGLSAKFVTMTILLLYLIEKGLLLDIKAKKRNNNLLALFKANSKDIREV